MKRFISVASLAFVAASSAHAYDSVACGPPDVRPDCEGLEAARTPWFRSEHAEIWRRTRVLAGLPDEVDAPFEVSTLTLGLDATEDWRSLSAAPLDLATTIERRQMEISVFAQLPDKAWALWDWASGNEGCPPTGGDEFDGCHEFTAHMGWLNSNHFLPQAEQAFQHHHALAIERANACAVMGQRLGDSDGASEVLQACDREALILEAIAQHYLQDAWSTGHMWQRWGSPDLGDFTGAVGADASLVSVKALGDAVGRASGIIHGARAISGIPDAMCAPDSGIAFVYGDEQLAGGGDLFLDQVNEDGQLLDQRELLYGCAATAMREVYSGGALSFGNLSASTTVSVSLADCFPQRATNRAIGLGAAVQVPVEIEGLVENAVFLQTSTAYLAALGIEAVASADFFYLPLTSSILSAVDIFGARLVDAALADRWNEDMGRIQDTLQLAVFVEPDATSLAEGGLGPLLSMLPNASYQGVTDYTDPSLPWTPTALVLPAEPRVENAANIMARTFVDAHAQDWCAVLHENGDDEFSLTHLRDRCRSLTEAGDPDAEVACDICGRFAAWMVNDPEPAENASPDLAEDSLCARLVGSENVIAESTSGDIDRRALADRWCAAVISLEQLETEGIAGCEGSRDTTLVRVRVVGPSGDAVAGVRVEFFIDGLPIGSATSDAEGIAKVSYDQNDINTREVVASANGVELAAGFFIANDGERCRSCNDQLTCDLQQAFELELECVAGTCDDDAAEFFCACEALNCPSGAGTYFDEESGQMLTSYCCGCA